MNRLSGSRVGANVADMNPEDATKVPQKDLQEYPLDEKRFGRLAEDIATLLTELIDHTNVVMTGLESRRRAVFLDLSRILDGIPARDQGVLLTRLEGSVQAVLDARGSPKVTVEGGCLGRPGGTVTATEGGVSVSACAVVQGGELIGGGVRGGITY